MGPRRGRGKPLAGSSEAAGVAARREEHGGTLTEAPNLPPPPLCTLCRAAFSLKTSAALAGSERSQREPRLMHFSLGGGGGSLLPWDFWQEAKRAALNLP